MKRSEYNPVAEGREGWVYVPSWGHGHEDEWVYQGKGGSLSRWPNADGVWEARVSFPDRFNEQLRAESPEEGVRWIEERVRWADNRVKCRDNPVGLKVDGRDGWRVSKHGDASYGNASYGEADDVRGPWGSLCRVGDDAFTAAVFWRDGTDRNRNGCAADLDALVLFVEERVTGGKGPDDE